MTDKCISIYRRLRQENCLKFEISLGYIVISKPAWVTMGDPILKNLLSLGNAITDLFSSLCFLSFYPASILNSNK